MKEHGRACAPIALFVYKRLWHTRQTIEALQRNVLACESELLIFSDGARGEADAESVQAVRDYMHQVGGFRHVTVVEREENVGLADNIISGVTEVVNRYGRIIVVEDDVVTTPHWLDYMNDALDAYEGEPAVWEISGTIEPYQVLKPTARTDTFFLHQAQCCGWATWADRWKYYNRDPEAVLRRYQTRDKACWLDEADYPGTWRQVVQNCTGQLRTWAVFWDITILEHGGLVLWPRYSLQKNTGFDGSGEHCGSLAEMQALELEDVHPLQLAPDAKLDDEMSHALHDAIFTRKTQLDAFFADPSAVVIYGAGDYGRRVLRYLQDRQIPVSRFFVTSADHFKEVEGIPVETADTLQPDARVIVALSQRWHDDVRAVLERRGVQHAFYVDDLLAAILETEAFDLMSIQAILDKHENHAGGVWNDYLTCSGAELLRAA